jgi:hypothetical protein
LRFPRVPSFGALRGSSCVQLYSLLMLGVLICACTEFGGPAETTRALTLSRTIELVLRDSTHGVTIDSIIAPELSSPFREIKERITRIVCSAPSIIVLEVDGSDSATIDSLILFVSPSGGGPGDTLSGPTFLTLAQLADSTPHALWANAPALWTIAHLLAEEPYCFSLRLSVHASAPLARLRVRLEFPLDVSHLN